MDNGHTVQAFLLRNPPKGSRALGNVYRRDDGQFAVASHVRQSVLDEETVMRVGAIRVKSRKGQDVQTPTIGHRWPPMKRWPQLSSTKSAQRWYAKSRVPR